MTQPCKGASIYFTFHHKNSNCNSARFPGCGGGEDRQCQGSRERCLTDVAPSHLPVPPLSVCGFPSQVPTREEGLRWDLGGPLQTSPAASASIGEGVRQACYLHFTAL